MAQHLTVHCTHLGCGYIYDKDKNASIELVDAKAKDGKRKVPIKVGISNGAKTEIVSNNLKKDDEVVLQ